MAATHAHEEATADGLSLRELTTRLSDALKLQGERVNRLEADLWEAIRSANTPAPPSA